MSECPRCKQLARQVGQLAGHNIEYHAEIERLRAHGASVVKEYGKAQEEIERLTAEKAELLAALCVCRKHLFLSSDIGASGVLDTVDAVIAKVEGK